MGRIARRDEQVSAQVGLVLVEAEAPRGDLEPAPDLPRMLGTYAYGPDVVLSGVLIVILLAIEILDDRRPVRVRLRRRPRWVRWAAMYALLFALVVLGVWNMNEFVYMQF